MDAMDFSVNIRAVTGLADALDLRAHNLIGAADYLQANKDLRYGSGLLAEFGVIPEQVDPFEAFTAPLCGDVAGLKKMSFVLCGVATAIGYVSDRIDVEADVMDRVWTGHAASGCRSALLRFARDLRPAVDLVVKLAEEYDRVAEAARANREVMDMALTLMLDEAMTLGLDDVVELGSIALLDAPRLAQIGARIWEVIVKAKEIITLMHLSLEAANTQMSDTIAQLGIDRKSTRLNS